MPFRFSTYRRVQVNEDGTGHIFAAARLGEEGLIGAFLIAVLDLWVWLAVGLETVFEEIARLLWSAIGLPGRLNSNRVAAQLLGRTMWGG